MSNKINLEQLLSEERAAIEMRREYQHKWRSEHKENVREHNKRYWLKKAQEQQNRKENENGAETNPADETH